MGHPLGQAVVATGLEPEVLRRLLMASGLGDQDEVYEEDLDALRSLKVALDAGLPEDAMVQIIRVYADALGRVVEAENRLFHHYVHERLWADGLEGAELAAATNAVGDPIMGLVEPAVL